MEGFYTRSKSTTRVRRISPQLTLLRLQQMSDKYTSLHEYEKTKSIMLDQEINDLKERLGRTRTRKASPAKKAKEDPVTDVENLRHRALFLENLLEITLTKVNKASTHNRNLRQEIDILRVNSVVDKEQIEKLSGLVHSVTDRKEQEAELTEREAKATMRLSSATRLLRTRSASHRGMMNEKIRTLTASARQRGLQHSSKDSPIQKLKYGEMDPRYRNGVETLEPTVVLKKLKSKWEDIVKTAKAKVSTLMQNLRVMRSGLEQVKRATGLDDIEQIMVTFVKSEDQQTSLSNYLSSLQIEAEQIELSYRRTQAAIKARADSALSFIETQQKASIELKQMIDKEHKRLEKLKLKDTLIEQQLQDVQTKVAHIFDTFESHEFSVSLPAYMNVTHMKSFLLKSLLKLESHIDEMVLFDAYIKQDKNPGLKLIAAMANKLFAGGHSPKREVLKINELLEGVGDVPEEPLSYAQLRIKAKEKIDLVTKISMDDLPNILRRRIHANRAKTQGRTPKEMQVN